MSFIHTIDMNLFASVMLLVLNISIIRKKNYFSLSTKLFSIMIWLNILLLLLEDLCWIVDGIQTPGLLWLPYFTNFIFLLSNPLPVIAWLCYLDYQVEGSLERLKKRWFYLQPMIVLTLLLLISLRNDFMFSIDDANCYCRGPGIIPLSVINYSILAFSLYVGLKKRNSIEKRVIAVMLSFTLLPVIGAFLQIKFLGLTTVWPSLALSILISYLFLENIQETRDYLTGLHNRRQVDEWVNFRIRKSAKQSAFTLVMMDLDDFKPINDCFGHKEGDRALVLFADILSRSLKRRDMVARFAGDEFLLVLETGNTEEVLMVLKRIRNMIKEYAEKENLPYRLSFSAGFATYSPGKQLSYKDLLHSADTNMYRMKKEKKAGNPSSSDCKSEDCSQ